MALSSSALPSRSWIGAVFLAPLLFFAMPKVEETGCLKHARLGDHVLFVHNCDSRSIASAARNLEAFVFHSADNPWRGRPLYITIGALGAPIVSPLAIVINGVFNDELEMSGERADYQRRYPVYLAFVFFQYACLFLVVTTVFRLLGGELGAVDRIVIALLIVTTDLVQAWFWQQHSIFFGVTVPLVGVLAFMMGYFNSAYSLRQLLTRCALLGLGVLIYQLSILWLPMFVCGFLFNNVERKKYELSRAGLCALVMVAPLIAWLAFNRTVGMPYAYEAHAYDQFVWLKHAFEDDRLLATMSAYLGQFLDAIQRAWGNQWIAPFGVCAVYLASRLRHEKPREVLLHPMLVAGILAIFGQLLFNYLQGFYQPRLLNPVLMVVSFLGIWLARAAGRHHALGAALVMLAWQLHDAFDSPPLTMT